MPTGTHSNDLFRPRRSPGVDMLADHAAGRLDPGEHFIVEHAMEGDALLRDAAEGFRDPRTAAALHRLHKLRPGQGPRWWPAVFIGLAVIIGASLWLPGSDGTSDTPPEPGAGSSFNSAPEHRSDAEALRARTELAASIEQAVDLPAPVQVGHRKEDRPAPDTAANDGMPERIFAREVPGTVLSGSDREMMVRTTRTGRKLLFLHDLKLVHPDDLYPDRPLTAQPGGLAADRSGELTPAEIGPAARRVAYVPYMDRALGHFVRNDHRKALAELGLVLDQYPADVNALFYSGLCLHNLGLFEEAAAMLLQAQQHSIDTFSEEAAFYRALSVERAGDGTAARTLYADVVRGKGFYAGRAAERLEAMRP